MLLMKLHTFRLCCIVFCVIQVVGTPASAEDSFDLLLQLPAILRSRTTEPIVYGEEHSGQYHLGPVDFAETQWHNACAPAGGYRYELRESVGLGDEYLVGLSNTYIEGGAACDRCIRIKTALDKSIVARVVTYGATNQPGDIDVSPSVFAALNMGEYPRKMTWQFTQCPEVGPIYYEFQTGAHQWWSSLWVRNAKVPISKVEVKSTNHPSYFELTRGGDGTFTDNGGFGAGEFVLRVTSIDSQVIEDHFQTFPTGQLIKSHGQFR